MSRIDERAEALKDTARHANAYQTAMARLQMYAEVCAGAKAMIASNRGYPKLHEAITLAIVFGEKSAAQPPKQTFNAFVDEYRFHVRRLANELSKKIDDDFINGVTP